MGEFNKNRLTHCSLFTSLAKRSVNPAYIKLLQIVSFTYHIKNNQCSYTAESVKKQVLPFFMPVSPHPWAYRRNFPTDKWIRNSSELQLSVSGLWRLDTSFRRLLECVMRDFIAKYLRTYGFSGILGMCEMWNWYALTQYLYNVYKCCNEWINVNKVVCNEIATIEIPYFGIFVIFARRAIGWVFICAMLKKYHS